MLRALVNYLLARYPSKEDDKLAVALQELFDIKVCLLSDPGCCRDHNEDSLNYFNKTDPLILARKGRLAIVADGMGGHAAGEVASRIAVDEVNKAYYESNKEPSAALAYAFKRANEIIYRQAAQNPQYKGMGTTCTALVIRGGFAYWANVGDSHLYLVRQGAITLQAHDDSIVSAMVKNGLINEEQARNHPTRSMILRALGTSPKVEVSVQEQPFPIMEDDTFVLCTDGLTDLVTDEEIKEFAMAQDLESSCKSLIALANERGGYDNISVGLIRIAPISASVSAIPPPTLPG